MNKTEVTKPPSEKKGMLALQNFDHGNSINTVDNRQLALGIETSCDETAVALVSSDRTIHCNLVYSQISEHRMFQGVVPEIAARAHLEKLPALFQRALETCGKTIDDVDLIAATAGPGLIGGLHVGLQFAKGLSLQSEKPILAINHLEGHALTPRLMADIKFPYLLLLVSGGHCQLLAVEGVGQYRRLGTTLEDAAGEAFDKVAKMLNLGYPGGPAVEAKASYGDHNAYAFKTPLSGKGHAKSCDFSFSGLKTAVRRQIELAGGLDVLSEQQKADLAAGFQRTVSRSLVSRCKNAITTFKATYATQPQLVVAGGVAANQSIISALKHLAEQQNLSLHAAPIALCTDNAAMIAWAGIERAQKQILESGQIENELHIEARPRWPLDPNAAKSIYAGAAKA